MIPLPILVDSFADVGLTNAQMANGRDIIRRLNPERFHVSVFVRNQPDPEIANRPNTRLIPLPARRQTPVLLKEFLFGEHKIHFYVKASPASLWYLRLRQAWGKKRITVGTIESQSDLRNEPTVSVRGVRLWEQTVLRCDYLFSNSRQAKRSLESEYGLPSEVVPTGVDTDFFSPGAETAHSERRIVASIQGT
jgi:glycosyltransferase involved in cell wall biosynthesis